MKSGFFLPSHTCDRDIQLFAVFGDGATSYTEAMFGKSSHELFVG
jgi:hypothetical protein